MKFDSILIFPHVIRRYFLRLLHVLGAGKSTLSAGVASRLDTLANVQGFSVVLPMDGFHYSRQQLKDMSRDVTNDPNSPTYEELLARRGSPWTFDAASIVKELTKAKAEGKASLPTYSRQLSDPGNNGLYLCIISIVSTLVFPYSHSSFFFLRMTKNAPILFLIIKPSNTLSNIPSTTPYLTITVQDGVALQENNKIVIVEGNYLLLYDDPEWAPLKGNILYRNTLNTSSQNIISTHPVKTSF